MEFNITSTDITYVIFAIVLKHLSANGVFIEYMYSFANGDVATVVIRPTDLDACEKILSDKKVELMAANDLYQL